MALKIQCPHCSQGLEAEEGMAGAATECPACGKAFRIPKAAPAGPASPAGRGPILYGQTPPPGPAPASARSAPAPGVSPIPKRLQCLLADGETVLYARNPSVSALILSILSHCCFLCLFVWGVPLVGLLFGNQEMPLTAKGAIATGIAITAGVAALVAYLNWSHRFYVITDQRTLTTQGIFNVVAKVVMNRNIQLISIKTGLIDGLLNLNTIELSTSGAGGAGGILAAFPGLSRGCITLKWVKVEDVMQHYTPDRLRA